MTTIYPNHQLQEFKDLLALSSLPQTTKSALEQKVKQGELTNTLFTRVLDLLHEEDKIDKEIQARLQTMANFDADKYWSDLQQIVEAEAEKLMRN